MALVRMGNQNHASNDSRLVDSSHVKNSNKDSTIDVTVDRHLRLVDTSHVKIVLRTGGYCLLKKSTRFAFGRQ